jgi:hypothetical protein
MIHGNFTMVSMGMATPLVEPASYPAIFQQS